MPSSLLSLLLISCLSHVAYGSLLNFGVLITEVTDKPSFPYYTSYGCHCGKGGTGMPVDDTDWCCWTHDCCYDELALEGCDPKGTAYRYTVYRGIVACGGYPKECGRKTCECDKAASLCFRKNFKTYKMKNMFKRDSTCKGQKPSCTYHSDASADPPPSSTDIASEKYTKEAQAPVQTETSGTSKQV